MNLAGVGLDLVDVVRVKRLIEQFGDRALERLLTPEERRYCLSKATPARCVAARVAAKEAAYKALSQAGADQVVWWQDVEVVRDGAGKPTLAFHGKGKAVAEKLCIKDSRISLTHSDSQAGAIVILLR